MRALGQTELLEAFDAIDRPQLSLPIGGIVPLGSLSWAEREYYSWFRADESTAFLVTALPERNVGLVLYPSSPVGRGMCDLCLGFDRQQGTRLFMAENWQRPRLKQGVHICADLNCSDTVRGGLWVYRMSETISVGRRIERLQERLERFVREVSGIQTRTGAA